MLVRGVKEVFDLREFDDVIELCRNLVTSHAVEPGSEEDVVANGEVINESAGDFNQGSNACVDVDGSLIGNEHVGYQFEQRGLTLSITSHHANCFTGVNVEAHMLQGPELVRLRATCPGGEEILEGATALVIATETNSCVRNSDHSRRSH